VPAAAVIPAPMAYIQVVAVKKLVVGFRSGRDSQASPFFFSCFLLFSRFECAKEKDFFFFRAHASEICANGEKGGALPVVASSAKNPRSPFFLFFFFRVFFFERRKKQRRARKKKKDSRPSCDATNRSFRSFLFRRGKNDRRFLFSFLSSRTKKRKRKTRSRFPSSKRLFDQTFARALC